MLAKTENLHGKDGQTRKELGYQIVFSNVPWIKANANFTQLT